MTSQSNQFNEKSDSKLPVIRKIKITPLLTATVHPVLYIKIDDKEENRPVKAFPQVITKVTEDMIFDEICDFIAKKFDEERRKSNGAGFSFNHNDLKFAIKQTLAMAKLEYEESRRRKAERKERQEREEPKTYHDYAMEILGDPLLDEKGQQLMVNEYQPLYSIITVVNPEGKPDMLWYDSKEGIWKTGAENDIHKQWAKIKELGTTSSLHNIISIIQGYTMVDTDYLEKEQMKGYICVRNGVLEVSTKTLYPYSPKFFLRHRIDVEYNPNAKCPVFMGIIENALREEKERLLLQEWFGFNLLSSLAKAMLFAIGIKDSAKSTIFRILEELLGGKAKCSFDTIEDLCGSKSSEVIAYQEDKVANFDFDCDKGIIKSADILKKLTSGGGDGVTGRKLYKGRKSMHPSIKLTFVGNDKPALSPKVVDDEAYWRRVILIYFANKVNIPKNKINEDWASLFKNVYEPELSGILNWALDGAKRYLAQGFTYDQTTTYARWFEEIEDHDKMVIKNFIKETYEVKVDSEEVDVKDFFYAFARWCKLNKEEIVKQPRLGMILDSLGYTRKRIKRNTVSVYKNLSYPIASKCKL